MRIMSYKNSFYRKVNIDQILTLRSTEVDGNDKFLVFYPPHDSFRSGIKQIAKIAI